MCGIDARVRMHTGTVASLCGRNPLRVVGLSRDTATGRRGRHRECPPTATPEHVMEHAWADRPKLQLRDRCSACHHWTHHSRRPSVPSVVYILADRSGTVTRQRISRHARFTDVSLFGPSRVRYRSTRLPPVRPTVRLLSRSDRRPTRCRRFSVRTQRNGRSHATPAPRDKVWRCVRQMASRSDAQIIVTTDYLPKYNICW